MLTTAHAAYTIHTNHCLIPRKSNPLLATSTAPSNSLASAAVQVKPIVFPLISSTLFALFNAVSKAFFFALSIDIFRGSECPVKMTNAVLGGKAWCSVWRCWFRVLSTGASSAAEGATMGVGGATGIVALSAEAFGVTPVKKFKLPLYKNK